jgi:hypothetical protein
MQLTTAWNLLLLLSIESAWMCCRTLLDGQGASPHADLREIDPCAADAAPV